MGTGTGSTPRGAVELAVHPIGRHEMLPGAEVNILEVVKSVPGVITPYRGSYFRVTHGAAVPLPVPPVHNKGPLSLTCLTPHLTSGDRMRGTDSEKLA